MQLTLMTLGLLAAVALGVLAKFDWWGMNYTDRGFIGLILVVFAFFGGFTALVAGIYHFWTWVI